MYGLEPPLESLPQHCTTASCSAQLLDRGGTYTQLPLMENVLRCTERWKRLETLGEHTFQAPGEAECLKTYKTIGHDAVQAFQRLHVFVGEEKLNHSRVSEEVT